MKVCGNDGCNQPLGPFHYVLNLVAGNVPQEPVTLCSTECVRSSTRKIDVARSLLESLEHVKR